MHLQQKWFDADVQCRYCGRLPIVSWKYVIKIANTDRRVEQTLEANNYCPKIPSLFQGRCTLGWSMEKTQFFNPWNKLFKTFVNNIYGFTFDINRWRSRCRRTLTRNLSNKRAPITLLRVVVFRRQIFCRNCTRFQGFSFGIYKRNKHQYQTSVWLPYICADEHNEEILLTFKMQLT